MGHPGHVEYVTDGAGVPYQYFHYSPWGESLISQTRTPNSTGFSTPYRFNAKELDSESGLFYYGARYYHPMVSKWLSVDPMAHERVSWTPYNAMRCNPILNIDPTGALDGEYYKINSNGELEHVGSDGIDDKKVYVQNSFGNKEFKGNNYYEVLGGQEAFKGDYNEGHKYVDNMALSRMKNFILEANGRRADKDLDYGQNPTSVGTASDIKWVMNESVRGDLDFKFFIAGKDPKTARNAATQTLYLVGDYYMNVNTFGNYVWGAYGAQLELPKIFFLGLAQAGSIIKQRRFDEPHEQKAIGLGYDFMKTTIKFEGSNNYKYSYRRKP
ncbi:RHS repeat domain-containing protein [Schleiferia thermophila]|uniref:RHS repeat domain-containing protein n=1 Tax=Schleiferia thermophila TaxID=884107 RepID=UPI001F3ACCE4|nr:RHS repeat-associated core domain-containing protein [Schleiferia thermophila]